MVESTKLVGKSVEDDFDEMLTMDTAKQQIRNTNTIARLQERSHTADSLENKIFEGDKEFLFPTQYAQNTRSYMTESSTSKNGFPVYESTIYEFYENDEVGLQTFLFNNPNLQCLIKIFLEAKPQLQLRQQETYRFFHSQILLYAIKNNKFDNLIFRIALRQRLLHESIEIKYSLEKKINQIFEKNSKISKLTETYLSYLYKYDDQFIVKQQRIQSDQNKDVKTQKLLDSIYEYQILIFEDNSLLNSGRDIVVIEDDQVVDYLWSRQILQVLSKVKNINQMKQEFICLQAIEYFAEYHSRNFFHGDIKPDNILIGYDYITSDAGTLLDLGIDQPEDTPRYVVTSFTPGFASQEHVKAAQNQTLLTKQQLMQEDKHQLLQTLKVFLICQKQKHSSKYCQLIFTLLSDPSLSIIQILSILKQDIDLMIHLMPVISSGYGRYYSHFIPENLFEDEETQNGIKYIKLPNVHSQHDKEKIYLIVMRYYKSISLDWKRLKDRDFENYFGQVGQKDEFFNWRKYYFIFKDYTLDILNNKKSRVKEQLLQMNKDQLLQFLMNFDEQQEYFLPREISKEVLRRVVKLVEQKVLPKFDTLNQEEASFLREIIKQIRERTETTQSS